MAKTGCIYHIRLSGPAVQSPPIAVGALGKKAGRAEPD